MAKPRKTFMRCIQALLKMFGLATDGFNPFGNMNTTYSMWPVLVRVYNLPPWSCTNASNCYMSLLILGPKSPGKDFDIFLQPLIEDLLKL